MDDGIMALITHSRCFLVISEMSLLLGCSSSPFVSSHFCCLNTSTFPSCVPARTQSVCLVVCVGDVLLLEAIGCALTKFAYDLHTEV